MTTTSFRSRAAVGVRHLLCCPVVSWCMRKEDNDILPQPLCGGCSSPFFRQGTTLQSGQVLVHAERCQRHPTAAVWRWVFVTVFPSRHYSAVRSRLGARGTMTTTSYRSRMAVGVRHLFSVEALLCCLVAFGCTRNDDNDMLPQPRGGGCSSPFSVEALLCSPVVPFLPQPLCCGCSSPFFRQGPTLQSG
ncbi:uncharacterized protein TNCV_2163201 [Trichonephila clavipes]|nr:uncharacterized protein TNCV_2163201 [Trichonephila clavipes]